MGLYLSSHYISTAEQLQLVNLQGSCTALLEQTERYHREMDLDHFQLDKEIEDVNNAVLILVSKLDLLLLE